MHVGFLFVGPEVAKFFWRVYIYITCNYVALPPPYEVIHAQKRPSVDAAPLMMVGCWR